MATAGERRCRIEIQAYAGATSPSGAQKPTWTSPGILRWAKQMFVTGGEQETGTRVTYMAPHRFIVPRPTPVNIKDRVRRLPDGPYFDVVAVDQSDPATIAIHAVEGQRIGS